MPSLLELQYSLFIGQHKLFVPYLTYRITRRQDSNFIVFWVIVLLGSHFVTIILSWGYHFLLQAFPDALLHQLLLAMAHPDHETRVAAHHVISIVLLPSLICPWLVCNGGPSQVQHDYSQITSRRIKSGSFTLQIESNGKHDSTEEVSVEEVNQVLPNGVTQSIRSPSRSQSSSFKHAMVNGKAVCHKYCLWTTHSMIWFCLWLGVLPFSGWHMVNILSRKWLPSGWVVTKWVFCFQLSGCRQHPQETLLQILRRWHTLTISLYYLPDTRYMLSVCLLLLFFFHFSTYSLKYPSHSPCNIRLFSLG